jgi:hypothetical protein
MSAGDIQLAKIQDVSHASLAIRRTCDVRREEYLDYTTFKANSRLLFTEIFGSLIGLKEEWVEQGATPEELDFSAFTYRTPMKAGLPVNSGWMGGIPEEVLEENDDYIIKRDGRGRTTKLCKGYATIALPLDYPVKNMDDWWSLLRGWT